MISAVRAFEIAHDAIAGKRCHDAPCDIAIERDGGIYTVTFSSPADSAPAAPATPTRVLVDALSGTVREVRNAMERNRKSRLAGLISAKRALEVGLATLRESGAEYDERWTTTVVLRGDKYYVTFPLPEDVRRAPLRSDYALLVTVDSRTGKVLDALGAA